MLYNYDYAKLISESQIEYAPLNAYVEGVWHCPASPEILRRLDYKEIVDVPYPQDGKHYTYHWIQTTKTIKKQWTILPDPEPLTPAEQREIAYETELICEWGDGIYTVDYMNDLWYKYSAEGNTEKSEAIQEIIAAAKADIRRRYPDN